MYTNCSSEPHPDIASHVDMLPTLTRPMGLSALPSSTAPIVARAPPRLWPVKTILNSGYSTVTLLIHGIMNSEKFPQA